MSAVKPNVPSHPVPYRLDEPGELYRLLHECHGYLRTCQGKHGTDFKGRQYAIDALAVLAKGDWKILAHPPETENDPR